MLKTLFAQALVAKNAISIQMPGRRITARNRANRYRFGFATAVIGLALIPGTCPADVVFYTSYSAFQAAYNAMYSTDHLEFATFPSETLVGSATGTTSVTSQRINLFPSSFVGTLENGITGDFQSVIENPSTQNTLSFNAEGYELHEYSGLQTSFNVTVTDDRGRKTTKTFVSDANGNAYVGIIMIHNEDIASVKTVDTGTGIGYKADIYIGTVPEPSSALLLGIAIAATSMYGLRSRSRGRGRPAGTFGEQV